MSVVIDKCVIRAYKVNNLFCYILLLGLKQCKLRDLQLEGKGNKANPQSIIYACRRLCFLEQTTTNYVISSFLKNK